MPPNTGQQVTGSHDRCLTPADVARRYGISEDKVVVWIRSGELRAINVATSRSGRPRWRIDPADLTVFESLRAAIPEKSQVRRRRQSPSDVIQFFK
jgi:hypothetical protein